MVMENITIEKMEIKRFNALLMRTIVGMLFMGVLMWETFCLDTGRKGFLGETWYIFAFAVLLYVVVAIRASDILERIVGIFTGKIHTNLSWISVFFIILLRKDVRNRNIIVFGNDIHNQLWSYLFLTFNRIFYSIFR